MHDLRFWNKHKSSMVIFDVGANVGEITNDFCRYLPGSRIYAAEPISETYEKLVDNCKKLKNVIPLNFGFGNKEDELDMYVIEDSKYSSVLDSSFAAKHNHKIEKVKVTTLDSFCSLNGIQEIDILKTDTEGFDLEVLSGGKNLLDKKSIRFIVSEATTLRHKTNNTSFFSLAEFLGGYGYVLTGFYDLVRTEGSHGPIRVTNALFEPYL